MAQTSAKVWRFALLCALAVLLLGLSFRYSAPRIAQQRQRRLLASSIELLGEQQALALRWASPPPLGFEPIRSYAKVDGQLLVELGGQGYGGSFRLLARYRSDGGFLAMRVFQHNETPGFGTRISRSWYGDIFLGDEAYSALIARRLSDLTPEAFDAAVGATISFRAVAQSLDRGMQAVQKLSRFLGMPV